MKKLVRFFILAAAVIVLFQARPIPTVRAFDHECVKGIATDQEYNCPWCCWNQWPDTIATYETDGGYGQWSYQWANGNCNGVLDPNQCTPSQCGSYQYILYTNAASALDWAQPSSSAAGISKRLAVSKRLWIIWPTTTKLAGASRNEV